MSEENKFWDDLDMSDLPTPPKRRRKKKTANDTDVENDTIDRASVENTVTEDSEAPVLNATPSSDDPTANEPIAAFENFGKVSSNSESIDEPFVPIKKRKARASDGKQVDEPSATLEKPIDEASDSESSDDKPAATVKKRKTRTPKAKKADEPSATAESLVDEPSDSKKVDEPTVAIENTIDEASDNKKADEPSVVVNNAEPASADNKDSQDNHTTSISIPLKNEEDGEYVGIEHFSDTLEIKYLSDEVEAAYVIDKEEEKPAIDAEYENLKIFEDREPEVKREPKQKRVREVSPDYKEYNSEKPRHVDARFEFVELFVYTLVVIMLITTFFFKHSQVEGWSMKGTLSDKDHLIISDFLYDPKQYDIVVLHDPEANDAPIVKRIIALGGQTVRIERRLVRDKSDDMISYYVTNVFVDGVAVPDSFCYYDGSDNIWPANHSNVKVMYDKENPNRFEYFECEYVVPEGEIYVMGDHRNDSKDSRVFGSVNENKILGRVLIRFFPFDSFGTVE